MLHGSVVNNLPANAGKEISVPGWERSPWKGQGNLAGKSPRGGKRVGHT